MMRVGVLGAGGRMGREVLRAVHAASDLELVAAIDPGFAGQPLQALLPEFDGDVLLAADLQALVAASCDLAVDFTAPSVAAGNIAFLLEHGIHGVVGTTGLDHEALGEAVKASPTKANLVVAANFAIGAVLLMQFAAKAARHLRDVEVIELHHDRKLDAPSGTAVHTAAAIAEARRGAGLTAPQDPTEHEDYPGSRGAVVDGVHVHAIRLPGLVAHEEVIFGGIGQTLSIRHDTVDRTAFMAGVLLALRAVSTTPGLTLGLDRLLEG